MKSVGVIVEYNPFHNGHAYHLQAAKETAHADLAVAVMSGNFLQRGEPALVSKWYRTKMALLSGVDIVLELPYQFATQKAETFANGAVSVLDAIGCHSLCFGSESGDISTFQQTVDYMELHKDCLDEKIKMNIKTGVSFPKALSLSFQSLSSTENLLSLDKPNNILGFHYVKALKLQKSSIIPLTIKRKNADYHDEHFATETIASATSIRKALFTSNNSSIEQYVPNTTGTLLKEYLNEYGNFHEWENYWSFLRFRLLHSNPEELREIYEVAEGIESRLIAAALESSTFKEFMEKVKTKRYTWTRIQRICVHILTNTKKTEMSGTLEKASYLRLLGMTKRGKEYLNKNKSQFNLPLISKLSAYKENDILLDIKASRVYSCGLGKQYGNILLQQEFKQPPIYVELKR
ncbi:nucleotidyltransferase [Bacillus sp. EB106-08-02-XG196]|uniref:nucleotidyltransferase n=1 Tax=Bacillus sp. EB106-08-02-XG196 TaxID=2737049 RepID=UPI0015C4C71F|nr:nucleotidyltransferase [Bacillus sp. EB106-08-02-XG196]NWQ43933.1 nucleotidyltransferase [Bacillus sp. EB106-08-02-XG196]